MAAGSGHTSAYTWLKVPAARDVARMLAVTTLPALILGGAPGPDPEATYASWEQAMKVPNVRGLVVGRALLYPPDGDVAGAIARAAGIVRPGAADRGWRCCCTVRRQRSPTATTPSALTPEEAGWRSAGLRVLRLRAGERRRIETGADEAVVLPLSTTGVTVEADGERSSWPGGRACSAE